MGGHSPAKTIGNLGASINGDAAAVASFGPASFSYLFGSSDAPFERQRSGLAGRFAACSGELSVVPTAPVPEPHTGALMLGGLGMLVLPGRRRHQDRPHRTVSTSGPSARFLCLARPLGLACNLQQPDRLAAQFPAS